MFKNMKIASRLGFGFGIVGVLILIVAAVSLFRMATLNSQVDILVNDHVPKTALANQIKENINVVARALRNVLLVKDLETMKKEAARIDESRKNINESIAILEKTIRSEKGKQLLSAVINARSDYLPRQAEVLKLSFEGKKDIAVTLMLGKLRDAQNKYFGAMDELIAYQNKLMTEAGKEAGSTYRYGFMIIATLCFVTLALSAGMAWIMAISIRRPMAQCVEVAQKIAKGDIDVAITEAGTSEIGLLLSSMKAMVENIKELIADANVLSTAAVEGRLATRVDAAKHAGDFRKIVQGVNDTLDAVIGPLNIAAQYVDRIAKGDIPSKITDSYNGDFNEIKNNLNTCIDAVNMLVADAVMLSKAAVEGKLATRADASKHSGDFQKIVQGVNDTLDTLVGLVDAMPTPAMIIDRDFNILYMNDIGAAVGGRKAKELAGTKCYDHFRTSDCKTAKCACSQSMTSGAQSKSETDAHPGSLNLEISYSAIPVKDKNGAIIGAFEVVTDQTEVKMAMKKAEKVGNYQSQETAKLVDGLERFARGDVL